MLVLLAAVCLTAVQASIVNHDSVDRVPGEYIVTLQPVNPHIARASKVHHLNNVIKKVSAMSEKLQVTKHFVIHDFLAFELHSSDEALVDALNHLPEVKRVEASVMNYAVGLLPDACQDDTAALYWGLRRVSSRTAAIAGQYDYYSTLSNSGVVVYILDTGIRISHQEFNTGRASYGHNSHDPPGAVDRNGHGTHCAGTAVGNEAGVARHADVSTVAVKVLGDSGGGSTGQVVDGVNWVVNSGAGAGNSVLSMSLGGGIQPALDEAVNAADAAGFPVVVAAGNSNANACNFSPAGASGAISIGSTQESGNSRSSFSNWGTCVDLFAPGSSVRSAWHTSDTAYNTISGTSMACPHVAGIVARYLSEVGNATPAQIRSWLTSHGTSGLVGNPGTGSPNIMAYAGCNLPPVA